MNHYFIQLELGIHPDHPNRTGCIKIDLATCVIEVARENDDIQGVVVFGPSCRYQFTGGQAKRISALYDDFCNQSGGYKHKDEANKAGPAPLVNPIIVPTGQPTPDELRAANAAVQKKRFG